MVTMTQTNCHVPLVLWLCLCTLACQSAEDAVTYVINGRFAKPYAYPWMLSLQFNSTHRCGAVLIAPDFAITAGHCLYWLQGRPAMTVVCGAHNVSNTKECSQQVIQVKNWTVHPAFSYSTTGPRVPNDIAVVHLSIKAKLNAYCKKATLSCKDFTHSMAILSGWGRYWYHNSTVNSGVSDVLREGDLRIMTDQACRQKVWWDGGNKTADYANLCADSNTFGGCNADSGSPLHVNQGAVVVGLTSWGDYLCRLSYPSVFTRVSTYIPWIRQTMQQMRST